MKYLLKAITTNNRDLKTAILFTIEERSYLFNCPDGFQRIALSNKMKFKSIRYIFFSQISPDYFGGFPGFYLSTKETQSPIELANFRVGALGPRGLKKALYNSRSFIGSLNYIESFEFDKIPNAIPVSQKEESKTGSQQEDDNASLIQGPHNTMIFRDNLVTIIPVKLESPDQRQKDVFSFIGIPKQPKGKFLPKIANALGLNPRVHFKILNEGNHVTLENGTIVYPFQVMEEPLPSECFILICMPDEKYLESVFSNNVIKQFEPYFLENINSKEIKISIIYHSVPLKCIINEQYKAFMRRFGPQVKHVIDCHESNDEIMSRVKGYTLTQRQKIVCPSLIPLSPLALRNFEKDNKELLKKQLSDIDYVHSKIGLVYNMFPLNQQNFDYSQVIQSTDIRTEAEEQIQNELKYLINGLFDMKKGEDNNFPFKQLEKMNSDFDEEPQILFLGTVSMKPTMYRSASAIMLFINNMSILMDCAEGSYGQIWDHFQDKAKVDEIMMGLRVVFITHIHGDHQLGIIKIMYERDKLITEYNADNKLYIVTPGPMMDWMELCRNDNLRFPEMVVLVPSSSLNPEPFFYYNDYEEKRTNPQKVQCPSRTLSEVNSIVEQFKTSDPQSNELLNFLQKQMNINSLLSIETDHCIESYGCLLQSPNFGRIFYSGDTSPCQNILNYAQNVTLLIHEATFEDSLEKDAIHKKHTTTGQAINIAEQCKPWRMVLTHFSPRYQKIAEITDRHFATKTMVAFDHMRLKLSYFEWAYQLLDIYRRVFTNDDVLDAGYGANLEDKIKSKKLANK